MKCVHPALVPCHTRPFTMKLEAPKSELHYAFVHNLFIDFFESHNATIGMTTSLGRPHLIYNYGKGLQRGHQFEPF